MKRSVYLICQKRNFNKGYPQVLSDGHGRLEYVYGSNEGLKIARQTVNDLNQDCTKQKVHLRKGIIIIGKEIKENHSQKG